MFMQENNVKTEKYNNNIQKGGKIMRKINNEQIVMLVLSLLVGLSVGYLVFSGNGTENFVKSFIEEPGAKSEENIIVNESNEKIKQQQEETVKEIKVYITGSVKNPGVYNMKEGDRIIDIFQKAGGKATGANLEQINMASYIKDGEKIYIPNLSERTDNLVSNTSNNYNSDSKININFASKDELEKLSGIGPSKATAIIKYRSDNGKFNTIKELINVTGIGPATLNNIKDEVSVR